MTALVRAVVCESWFRAPRANKVGTELQGEGRLFLTPYQRICFLQFVHESVVAVVAFEGKVGYTTVHWQLWKVYIVVVLIYVLYDEKVAWKRTDESWRLLCATMYYCK